MSTVVQCPRCGSTAIDVRRYDSMMVLSEHLALFALQCPECATPLASVCVIPDELLAEVEQCARALGAGMGQKPAGC